MPFDLTPDPARRPCTSPKAKPGTVALLEVLTRRHHGSRSLGIYNCRPVRGGASLSKHAVSEALDLDPGADSSPEGYAIAEALVAAAPHLGVQRIIWDGRTWTASLGWRAYRGSAGPHRDHLHIELTSEAARGLTMAAIVAAYGLKHRPKKEPGMPNRTDTVAAVAVAGKGGTIAILKLEAQGGVISDGEPLHFHGSMLSKGMLEHTRASSGTFTAIVNIGKPADGEYAIVSSAGQVYRFTKDLGRRLAKLE